MLFSHLMVKVIMLVHKWRKGTSILREISAVVDECLYKNSITFCFLVFIVRLPEDDLMFANDSQEEDAMICQVG